MTFTPNNIRDRVFHAMRNGRVRVLDRNNMLKDRRVYSDGGGFYVRTGRSGTRKEYITGYEDRFIHLRGFTTLLMPDTSAEVAELRKA